MAAQLIYIDQRRLFNDSGLATGATISFFRSGTSSPISIFSDSSLTTPLTNPVTVNAGAVIPDIYYDDSEQIRRRINYADGTTDDQDPYILPNYLSGAQAAQTAAEAAQAAAETAETNAGTAETNAETAETAAETARDAAIAAIAAETNFYHDTTIAAAITTAEAALTTNDTFFAIGDDVTYIAVHEMTSASASEERAKLSTQAEIDAAVAELEDLAALNEPTSPDSDLLQHEDDSGNVIWRIDQRGGVHMPGGGTIQGNTRVSLAKPSAVFQASERNPTREAYTSEVRALMATLQEDCLPFIEAPPLLVPNNYTIPDGVLSDVGLSFTDGNIVTQLKFPYGEGGSVHPYILPMRRPLYGYNYLLTDCDHILGVESQENPCLFGTNDLVNFDLIPDAPQPMHEANPGIGTSDPVAALCSDPFFAYDPTDGGLIWLTRETDRVGSDGVKIIGCKTYDGREWTEKRTFDPPAEYQGVQASLSPSLLYNPSDSKWHLFTMGSGGLFEHNESDNWYGPWTRTSRNNFNTTESWEIWHGEVKFVGDKYWICAANRDANTDIANIRMASSSDGDTWTVSGDLVAEPTEDIYKPTFFVEFNSSDEVRFTLFWTKWDWIDKQGWGEMPLYSAQSAWIDHSGL